MHDVSISIINRAWPEKKSSDAKKKPQKNYSTNIFAPKDPCTTADDRSFLYFDCRLVFCPRLSKQATSCWSSSAAGNSQL